jgi:hypothetical protein
MAGLLDTLSSYASRAASPIDYMATPANARMLLKSMFNPSQVSESNFTNQELNALRKAYANTQNRINRPVTDEYRNRIENLKSMDRGDEVFSQIMPNNKVVPVGLEEDLLKRQISPTLQYADYSLQNKNEGVAQAPITRSFDPAYSMQTTIGRAKYVTDPQGNIHVIDTYDFPKSSNQDDYGTWNKGFAIAHGVGEKFSNKMPVDINLGKIKSILDKKKVK